MAGGAAPGARSRLATRRDATRARPVEREALGSPDPYPHGAGGRGPARESGAAAGARRPLSAGLSRAPGGETPPGVGGGGRGAGPHQGAGLARRGAVDRDCPAVESSGDHVGRRRRRRRPRGDRAREPNRGRIGSPPLRSWPGQIGARRFRRRAAGPPAGREPLACSRQSAGAPGRLPDRRMPLPAVGVWRRGGGAPPDLSRSAAPRLS
jgi:hypothetical protein